MPRTTLAALCALASLGADASLAQPDFTYTLIVDPTATNSANYTSIQDAIDRIPVNPSVRYTVLIYAGVYEEEVLLDDEKENVDLIGVDPDAVIIRPPLGDNGVIISGFGARNNTVRNLTIEVPDNTGTGDNLDGVLITKPGSGSDPSGITLDNVTIRVEADASRAVRASVPVSDITLTGVTIGCTADGGVGVRFDEDANDITFTGSSITTAGDDGYGIAFMDAALPVDPSLHGLLIDLTEIVTGGNHGHAILINRVGSDILVRDTSVLLGGEHSVGFRLPVSLPTDSVSEVEFDGLVLRSAAAYTGGLTLPDATGVRILNCDIRLNDGVGIYAGNDTTVIDTTCITEKVSGGGGADDNAGLDASGKTGLVVRGCHLEARLCGVRLDGCSGVVISDSVLNGSHYGLFCRCGEGIEIARCTISASSRRGLEPSNPPHNYNGVYIDDGAGCESGAIRVTDCRVAALSEMQGEDAIGVTVMAAPPESAGPAVFANCTIWAHQEFTGAGSDNAQCFGVRADEADSAVLLGGSVTSSDGDEREADQYDIRCPETPLPNAATAVAMSGVECSKWRGPVGAAVSSPVVQRTIGVPAATPDGVLGATALGAGEQAITGGITDPQGYRVLSVSLTGAQAADATFIIIGTNSAGTRIAEAIGVAQGQTAAQGRKPFRTVSKIILPPGSGSASIGTADALGLAYPVAGASSVQQQGIMASAASSYTIGVPGTVDASFSTVDAATITAGDSFEWALVASD